MTTQLQQVTLRISGVKELAAANADAFHDEVRAALPPTLHAIEIDLSETSFVDSRGLGALVSLYNTANHRNGGIRVRLLNPTRAVQQLFELTRMHRMFEIVPR